MRVGVVVIQLDAAVEPFRVAPAFRAHGASELGGIKLRSPVHLVGVADNGERGLLPRTLRSVEQRNETQAFKVVRFGQPASSRSRSRGPLPKSQRRFPICRIAAL